MTAREIELRLSVFPDAIHMIARSDAVVREVLDRFLHGYILTKEEALCRMVVQLCRQRQARAETEFTRILPIPPIPPIGPIDGA